MFKQYISEFTKNTNTRKFLEQLDNHVNMWHEMTTFKSYFTLFKLSFIKKYNKLFYQNRVIEKNIDNFSNRDIRFSHNSNNAYNNLRQKQSDRFCRLKIIIKMKNSRFELNERDSNRNSRNKKYNKNKEEYNRSKDRNKNKYRDKSNKNKKKSKT